MSAETEHIIEKLQQTRNQANKHGDLIRKQIRFLTRKERRARETEKEWIDGTLTQAPWVLKDVPGERIRDLKRRRAHLEKDLDENSPPTDLNGQTKDKLYGLQKDLEDKIQVGMPTAEVMRRNPPGAVDMHTRWEKANKDRIIQWKNVKRLLDPENEDKDYTNVETLRSAGLSPDTAATFMMGAQIPGSFAMTPLAKANWPLGEPKVDTPLKQAERQELAEEIGKEAGISDPAEIEKLKEQIRQLQQKLDSKDATKEKRRAAMAKARAARKTKQEVTAAVGG